MDNKPDEQLGQELFARFARWIERQAGRSTTFVGAIAMVMVWLASGPVFHWSDTWQLIINTSTNIVQLLMVFLIQNAQSRGDSAIQLKLDELIRANEEARNSMMSIEEMSEGDVERIKFAFERLSSKPSKSAASVKLPGAPS